MMERQRMRHGSTTSLVQQQQLGSDLLLAQSGNYKTSTKNTSRTNGGSTESNVVKSLLTGNKYFTQSSNRQKTPKQEEVVDAGQQNIVMANLPTSLAPGEKLVACIGGIAYEIVQGPNQDFLAHPIEGFQPTSADGNNISLEDLANISAEQESVRMDQGVANISVLGGSADQTHQLENHHQVVDTTSAGADEAMQIIVMPQDGQQQITGTSIQELLQSGHTFPPEIQELLARGAIDLSSCEFVIQSEADGQVGTQQQVFITGGSGATHYDAAALQEILQNSQQSYLSTGGGEATIVNTNDVLTLLAEASTAVAQHELSGSIVSNVKQAAVGGVALAPDEEDEEEFGYIKSMVEDEEETKVCTVGDAKAHSYEGFTQAFLAFLSGVKPETLTTAPSVSVTKKPLLPSYIPEYCPLRKNANGEPIGGEGVGSDIERSRKLGYPYGVRGRGGPGRRGRGRDMTGRIIGRRTRGSDDDSYDDVDDLDHMLTDSDESDPGWKPYVDSQITKKVAQPAVSLMTPKPRGRGRGRPRGSGRKKVDPWYDSEDSDYEEKPAHRGRGRPRGRGLVSKSYAKDERGRISNMPMPETGQTVCCCPNDAHTYQKGDFVLERKDFYKREGFPIWKIEAGRLLQKFDPVMINDELLHKSASVYSSWTGDVRSSFKAIKVELVNTNGKKQEVVKVSEEYLGPESDDSLQNDALMELFSLYVRNTISQGLDNSFFASILESNEEYYYGSMKEIDDLLVQAQSMLTSQVVWTPKFKEALDTMPCYKVVELIINSPAERHYCQATNDPNVPATRMITLYGPEYNQVTLEVKEHEGDAAEANYLKHWDSERKKYYLIGESSLELITTYHALQHFKFLLFKDVQDEVTYKRVHAKDKSDEAILMEISNNYVWVQQHLKHLKDLLQKCSIVISVVTKNGDQHQQMLDPRDEVEQLQASSTAVATTTAGLDINAAMGTAAVSSVAYEDHRHQLIQQHELRDDEDMEGVIVSTGGLTYNIDPQHQGGITVMQVDADGNEALEVSGGRTLGLVQLEDGSVVQAYYDPSMLTLLQQQQLTEVDQSQLTSEQQQILQQQLLLQQQQLVEIDQLQMDPEQQLLLQQQQLAEQEQQELGRQDQTLGMGSDGQMPM